MSLLVPSCPVSYVGFSQRPKEERTSLLERLSHRSTANLRLCPWVWLCPCTPAGWGMGRRLSSHMALPDPLLQPGNARP